MTSEMTLLSPPSLERVWCLGSGDHTPPSKMRGTGERSEPPRGQKVREALESGRLLPPAASLLLPCLIWLRFYGNSAYCSDTQSENESLSCYFYTRGYTKREREPILTRLAAKASPSAPLWPHPDALSSAKELATPFPAELETDRGESFPAISPPWY